MVVYAVTNPNDSVRENSSSGGAFALLCEAVIRDGGSVLAPIVGKDATVQHCFADSVEEIAPMLGAKYVQSSFVHMLEPLRARLEEGRTVLFSGTPCQAASVKQYLKKDYPNLLMADIICHGTPQRELWQKYKQALEAQFHAELDEVSFRDRTEGWENYRLTMRFGKKLYSNYPANDFYMTAFLRNYSLTEACYSCKFKGENRASDITLGDFWGAGKHLPASQAGKGATLVFCRTEKGENLLSRLPKELLSNPIAYEAAIEKNPSYHSPAAKPKDREQFLAFVSGDAFTYSAARSYFPRSWKQKLHQFVRNRQYLKRRQRK